MKIELWECATNKQEVHLFDGDDTNVYILGYNPEKLKAMRVLDLLDVSKIPYSSEEEEKLFAIENNVRIAVNHK